MNTSALLTLDSIHAGYGPSRVLHGLSVRIEAGEFVTLLGRNGMGKSTTVKCIMGLLPTQSGTLHFGGRDMTSRPSHQIARAGIGLVPEGRQIFPNLTVEENLIATARPPSAAARTSTRLFGGSPSGDPTGALARAGGGQSGSHPTAQNDSPGAVPSTSDKGWDLERVYDLFPRLKERRSNPGTRLSGGEQQMLAIGRALMINPALLILDEATEGLAPLVRRDIWEALRRLKETGLSILCIDKHLSSMLPLADRHYIVEKGKVAWEGSSAAYMEARDSLQGYLGV